MYHDDVWAEKVQIRNQLTDVLNRLNEVVDQLKVVSDQLKDQEEADGRKAAFRD
jgi:hypothetical protein